MVFFIGWRTEPTRRLRMPNRATVAIAAFTSSGSRHAWLQILQRQRSGNGGSQQMNINVRDERNAALSSQTRVFIKVEINRGKNVNFNERNPVIKYN